MVPTFIGILLITFFVMRLRSTTFSEEAQATAGKGGEGVASSGDRKAGGASKRYQNLIDRFRRTGNDLPAVLNTHGFLASDDVLADLRAAAPDSPLKPSARSEREKELWLAGRFAVLPLAEVLRDDALAPLHGPASQALALCAHRTLDPPDFKRLPASEVNRLQARNQVLAQSVIGFRVESATPAVLAKDGSAAQAAIPAHYVTTDSALRAAAKRQALLAIADDPANQDEYGHSSGRAWRALLIDTGFMDFLRRLCTGDLYSETQQRGVFALIGERWVVTFWLNLLSILIAWSGSIALGIRSARRAGSLEDRATTGSLFFLWSLPSFFVGALFLHYLCTDRDAANKALFPASGLSSPNSLWMSTPLYLADLAWHAFLPLVVLSYGSFTSLSRYLRGNLLDQFNADYARTARAKGCSEDRVVYRHVLRNSSLTMITLGSGLLADLFGGALIVEIIFSIPGLGLLLFEGAKQMDIPLVMGSTVISVGLLLISILVADLLYAAVDPRIRSRYG